MAQQGSVQTDVLIVGGGVAGLSFSIHLADLIAKHNETAAEKQPLNVLWSKKGPRSGAIHFPELW